MIRKYIRYGIRIVYSSFFSVLKRNVTFAKRIMISPKCELSFDKTATVTIDNYASFERGSFIAARDNAVLDIGENVYINRNCMIVAHEKIVIGDGVTIGPNCCIYDHDHDLKFRGNFNTDAIIIKENVWIGAGVLVLKGVTIGEGAVIPAGAIVLKDVPANCILLQKRSSEFVEIKK